MSRTRPSRRSGVPTFRRAGRPSGSSVRGFSGGCIAEAVLHFGLSRRHVRSGGAAERDPAGETRSGRCGGGAAYQGVGEWGDGQTELGLPTWKAQLQRERTGTLRTPFVPHDPGPAFRCFYRGAARVDRPCRSGGRTTGREARGSGSAVRSRGPGGPLSAIRQAERRSAEAAGRTAQSERTRRFTRRRFGSRCGRDGGTGLFRVACRCGGAALRALAPIPAGPASRQDAGRFAFRAGRRAPVTGGSHGHLPSAWKAQPQPERTGALRSGEGLPWVRTLPQRYRDAPPVRWRPGRGVRDGSRS